MKLLLLLFFSIGEEYKDGKERVINYLEKVFSCMTEAENAQGYSLMGIHNTTYTLEAKRK